MLGPCACALLIVACNAYDAGLLREPATPAPKDAGQDTGPPLDDGLDGGSQGCVPEPETCNAVDDDCDSRIDEDTLAYCESVIVHAETKCLMLSAQGPAQAACVQLSCLPGFDDCDGTPQNGCEKPFCECNACRDAGEDAGENTDTDTDAGGL